MELRALQSIAQELDREEVQYLVVGGMAVVAHGYGRMTFDIDLVINLDPKNVIRAFKSLSHIGYRPTVPVSAADFANPAIRESWIKEKGMVVLNMWSPDFPDTPVDIFVTAPFDFEKVHTKALREHLDDGTPVYFVDIPTLIQMKMEAGRQKDMDDIDHLKALADEED